MWPLTGLEIVNVCACSCADPGLAEVQIAGVKADGTPPEPDELFVALREPSYDFDGHGWVLPYLRAGAGLALVAADWPLLPTLPLALRRRCIGGVMSSAKTISAAACAVHLAPTPNGIDRPPPVALALRTANQLKRSLARPSTKHRKRQNVVA